MILALQQIVAVTVVTAVTAVARVVVFLHVLQSRWYSSASG